MNGHRRSACGGARRGFTLVELMVALALLLIFGLMAVTTLAYGTQLWRSAHRRSYAYDVATVIFEQFQGDLSATRSQFWAKERDAFDTRVKFWLNHDGQFDDAGSDWERQGGHQILRFVREIPDESVNPRIRQAGDSADNDGDDDADEEYYNLKDDDADGRVDEDLRALEGMCEVAYMMGVSTGDTRLYRAVLAPIGGSGNLGDPQHTFFDETIFGTQGRINDKAVLLADNILHFEVRCWTQWTSTWDLPVDEDGDPIPFHVWNNPVQPEPSPPVFTWDSDRLVNPPPPSTPWSPPFLMDPGATTGIPADTEDQDGDGVDNQEDPDYVRDNVFPRKLLVVVVVDPTSEYPEQNPLRLREELAAADTTIYVRGSLPAYNKAWPYIRIGDEWIRFESFQPTDQGGQFIVASAEDRGVRGTAAADHSVGALVRFGLTFSRVYYCPAGKDY